MEEHLRVEEMESKVMEKQLHDTVRAIQQEAEGQKQQLKGLLVKERELRISKEKNEEFIAVEVKHQEEVTYHSPFL